MTDRERHLLMDACHVLQTCEICGDNFRAEARQVGEAIAQVIANEINEPVEVDGKLLAVPF